MFRIKASYSDQLELKTTLARAREFFGEFRNFVDLMPNIEGIRKEAGGIMRWIVCTEVPIIGSVHASFAVEKTDDRPDRLEWSPALIRIAQHVELRRLHARDLHRFAALVGEGAISAEMQKRVREMIKVFLERAQAKLEGEAPCEQEPVKA